jgi:hypothetical protein
MTAMTAVVNTALRSEIFIFISFFSGRFIWSGPSYLLARYREGAEQVLKRG